MAVEGGGQRDTPRPSGKHFQWLQADQTQWGESPQLPVCGALGHRSRPASTAASASSTVSGSSRPCLSRACGTAQAAATAAAVAALGGPYCACALAAPPGPAPRSKAD